MKAHLHEVVFRYGNIIAYNNKMQLNVFPIALVILDGKQLSHKSSDESVNAKEQKVKITL